MKYTIILSVLSLLSLIFTSSTIYAENDVDLNTLPQEWIRLSESENGLIIYNSCDGGNLLIRLTAENNKPGILMYGRQEDYEFEIVDSNWTDNTIKINAFWKGSVEPQDFEFVWIDKEKGLGRWITTYQSSGFTEDHIFVTAEKQGNYPVIDQPCTDCWAEEDCQGWEKDE